MSNKMLPDGWSALCGDTDYIAYGGLFMRDKPITIGLGDKEHDAYAVLEFVDAESAVGMEAAGEVWVSLSLVCPSALTPEQMKGALDSVGLSEGDMEGLDPLVIQIEAIHQYGYHATIEMNSVVGAELDYRQKYDDLDTPEGEKALWAKVVKNTDVLDMMVGFYLDRPQNRRGNTGWDFLVGKIG